MPITYATLASQPDLAGWARDLFDDAGIRLSGIEAFHTFALDGEEVVGALAFGSEPDEMGVRLTFSIVVEESYRRQGIACQLVKAALEAAQAYPGAFFRVWVVNPHMAVLLEDMGFEPEGREWSQESPHMYLYV